MQIKIWYYMLIETLNMYVYIYTKADMRNPSKLP